MARVGVQIVGDASSLVRAFRTAGTEGKRFGRQMQSTQRATSKTNAAFSGFSKSLVAGAGITFGLAGVASGLRSVVEEAMASQKVEKQLRAQLKASGIAYASNADEINRVIASQSQLAAVDDEIVKGSLTTLIRSTGDLTTAFKLNALALDVAAAKNISLESAAKLVGKVQKGNISAFNRYGVVVKKGTSVTEALAQIQAKFGGQAKAAGSGAEGAFKRFGIALGNLKEALGAGLLPVLTRVANVLSAKLADPAVQKRIEEIGRAIGEKLMRAVSAVSSWVSTHGDDLKSVWGFVSSSLQTGAAAAKALISALRPIVSIVPSDKLLIALGVLYGSSKIGGLSVPGRGGGKAGKAGTVKSLLPLPVKAAVAVAAGGIATGKLEDSRNAAKFRALPLPGKRKALQEIKGFNNAREFFGVTREEYDRILSPRISEKISNWQAMGARFQQDMGGTIRATGAGGGVYHTFAPGSPGYGLASDAVNISGSFHFHGVENIGQMIAELQRMSKGGSAQARGRLMSGGIYGIG